MRSVVKYTLVSSLYAAEECWMLTSCTVNANFWYILRRSRVLGMNTAGLFNNSLRLLLDENSTSRLNGLAGKWFKFLFNEWRLSNKGSPAKLCLRSLPGGSCWHRLALEVEQRKQVKDEWQMQTEVLTFSFQMVRSLGSLAELSTLAVCVPRKWGQLYSETHSGIGNTPKT